MKLAITVDGHESYLVLKDSWSRRDLRDWEAATDQYDVLTPEEKAKPPKERPVLNNDERAARMEARAFALLDSWCSEARLVVTPERTVHRVAELTPADGLDMDASLYRFLMQAPWAAYRERSRLGEPTVERSADR
jgi:hypothetical protein